MATYCSLAFHSLCLDENGYGSPCCISQSKALVETERSLLAFSKEDWPREQFNNPLSRDIRLSLANDAHHKACSTCFHIENSGGVSLRQRANKHYLDLPSGSQKTMLPDGSMPGFPKIFDLQLGNTCNLKCRMCHPTYSHALSRDFCIVNNADPSWFPRSHFWDENDALIDSIVTTSPKGIHLRVIGGEPMISKQFKNLVIRLGSSDAAKHSTLVINTNLTRLDQEVLHCFSKFKSVSIIGSIDGTPELNNYIRYPSQFNEIESNLKTLEALLESGGLSSVEFNTTVQIYNIFNIPDLIEYLKGKFPKFDWVPSLSPLVFPTYFSIQALPQEIKEKARNALSKYSNGLSRVGSEKTMRTITEISALIQFMDATDSSALFPEFLRATSKYDALRSQTCPQETWKHFQSDLPDP